MRKSRASIVGRNRGRVVRGQSGTSSAPAVGQTVACVRCGDADDGNVPGVGA